MPYWYNVTHVTTRNVATPGNVAKKNLPKNLANFVGVYIFGESPENVADTDPTGNVATSPENVAGINNNSI